MAGPTFLVVGAGRSGTTGLIEGLRGHPDVFVTRPKEPHYFAYHGARPAFRGPGDELGVNSTAVTDRAAYLALYESGGDAVARGEGSVSTFYHHERAIPEIQRLAPDARIVVLLREPVERAHSAFDYLAQQDFEPAPTLLGAIAEEDRRVAEEWQHLYHYTRMSKYAAALAAFQDAFGRDRVGVWFYDDLQADYAGTLREVLRFIGTTEHPGETDRVPVVNVSGTPRSRVVHAVLTSARESAPVRRAVKRVTTFELREAVRRRLLARNELAAEVRRELEPVFAADLAALRGLVPVERHPAWLRSTAD